MVIAAIIKERLKPLKQLDINLGNELHIFSLHDFRRRNNTDIKTWQCQPPFSEVKQLAKKMETSSWNVFFTFLRSSFVQRSQKRYETLYHEDF